MTILYPVLLLLGLLLPCLPAAEEQRVEVDAFSGLFDAITSYFPTHLFMGGYLKDESILHNDDMPPDYAPPALTETPPIAYTEDDNQDEATSRQVLITRQEEALLALLPNMKRGDTAPGINWDRDLPMSMWTRVVLDDDTGLVQQLLLNDVGLVGDLSTDLGPLLTPSLRRLQLIGNSDLRGDIAWLGRATGLEEAWLYTTAVSGDVKVFSRCPRIRIVGLYATAVHGSIEIFKTTKHLEMLVAAETNVWGDISVFAHTPRLTKLNLMKCGGVSGDIGKVFGGGKFPNLQALGLSDSHSVTGDIGAFRDTPHLQDLRLWNTGIVGDVAVFAGMDELMGLNLHKTGVIGNGMVFETCCPALKELHLWQTATYGDAQRLRDARMHDIAEKVYVDWDGKR